MIKIIVMQIIKIIVMQNESCMYKLLSKSNCNDEQLE